jgi:hypothetical protein
MIYFDIVALYMTFKFKVPIYQKSHLKYAFENFEFWLQSAMKRKQTWSKH